MSGFTYFINAQVNGANSLNKLAQAAEQASDRLNRIGVDSERAGRRGTSAFDSMKSSVGGFIAQVGIAAVTLSSLNTAADTTSLDNAIKFAGGKDGVENLAFVNKAVDDLKTPIESAKKGFKILSGGMMESGISAEQQRDIYYSVAEASRVMGLSADDTTGALIALGQVASKGKVQAEELRGQLGERIPGAFSIAARAMGMTTQELDKTMATGNLMAKDFLPKFAAEMHKTFGPGLTDALASPRAKFDEMQNSLIALKNVLGTELMPTAINLINNFLIPGATWIGQNTDAVFSLAGVMGIWIGLTKTATIWQGLYTAATKASAITQLMFTGSLGRSIAMSTLSTLVTGGLTGAVTALNAAFWANPIMWVVGGLATLAIGIKYAWEHFEKFRGTVIGVWNWLKELGSMIWDNIVRRFAGMGQVLEGMFTLDFNKIKEGVSGLVNSGGAFENAGERLGKAFDSGWNTGIDSFAKDQEAKPNALTSPSYVPPGSPGAPGGDGGLGGKAKASADSITGGGQRNITINIGEMGNDMTINVTNLKDAPEAVRDNILKSLLQVVNGTNQVQLN